MVILNLFPLGVAQLQDALANGYWHARSTLFMDQPWVRTLEWARLPGDAIFIVVGVVPLLVATFVVYWRAVWCPRG
jgi:nitric oxide reductase subunit B